MRIWMIFASILALKTLPKIVGARSLFSIFSPRHVQDAPKMPQDASKTPPRHLQDASKTPLDSPKTSPSCLKLPWNTPRMPQNWNIWKILEIFIVFHLIFHHFSFFQASHGEAKGRPFWVSNLFVKMYLQHIEMNIEADVNHFKWMFGNREWVNPWKLNVLKTCPGCCGWNMSSQKPHWWHEASGCTQYSWVGCVFHCRHILLWRWVPFPFQTSGRDVAPWPKTWPELNWPDLIFKDFWPYFDGFLASKM